MLKSECICICMYNTVNVFYFYINDYLRVYIWVYLINLINKNNKDVMNDDIQLISNDLLIQVNEHE